MRTWTAIGSVVGLLAGLIVFATTASATASADLRLSATSMPQRNLLDVTVRVKNAGPSTATNVVIIEDFAGAITSAGETATSHNNTSCAPAGVAAGYNLAYACKIPQLANGATWALTYAVHAPTGTSIRALAATNSSVADPTTRNNSAKLSNWAGPVQDLDIFGNFAAPPSEGVETVIFKVENLGPNSVTGRVTVDITTTELMFTSESPNGNCTGGVFTGECVFDALPVDGTWSATLQCTGPVNLQIKPVAGAFDPNTNNNVLALES